MWESIAVEISGGSRIEGRGMGRDWAECEDVCEDEAVGVYRDGRTGGKYRWKKIVCRTPAVEVLLVFSSSPQGGTSG